MSQDTKGFWRDLALKVASGAILALLAFAGKAVWPQVQTSREQVLFYGVAVVVGVIYSALLLWAGRRIARRVDAGTGILPSAPAVSTAVVATKKGFDGFQLRHPGDRFTMTLVPGRALPTWVQLADTALTPEERFEIEFVRTLWLNSGNDACRAVSQVLDNIIQTKADANVNVLLFRPVRDDLNNARDQLETALDKDNPLPFKQVTSRLVLLLKAYVRAVAWMNHYLKDNPSYAETGPFRLSKWEEWHAEFATDIEKKLAPRSRFSGLALLFNKKGREILPS